MRSSVWPGDIIPSQLYGFTSLLVEPLWLRRHFHCGVDLPMVVGTPLRAPFDGKITYVGYALLAMTDGFTTAWFVHIDRSVVAQGQVVTKGQIVCYSGNKVPSGGATTGPHLHLEFQSTSLPLHGQGGSSTVNNAGAPGNLNYPASSLDPADVLGGLYGGAGGELTGDDDMVFIGPRHQKSASLTFFTAGSAYLERSSKAPKAKDFAKGAIVIVDAYCYSTEGVASPDLSGSTGTQPGLDFVWWHAAGVWIPDAFLNTSKLVGAPTPARPATEPIKPLFAIADELASSVQGLPGPPGPAGPPGKDGVTPTKATIAGPVTLELT